MSRQRTHFHDMLFIILKYSQLLHNRFSHFSKNLTEKTFLAFSLSFSSYLALSLSFSFCDKKILENRTRLATLSKRLGWKKRWRPQARTAKLMLMSMHEEWHKKENWKCRKIRAVMTNSSQWFLNNFLMRFLLSPEGWPRVFIVKWV